MYDMNKLTAITADSMASTLQANKTVSKFSASATDSFITETNSRLYMVELLVTMASRTPPVDQLRYTVLT